ncbi:hypothetical protein ERO13_D05G319866v2 [Gossypium hirsutum]|uniref:Uncharacterized protein n=2 Tax=Gossypium TaxID=3633 RepID=A0A5J5RL90_GOSBA|nr:hypothetical protein ES319_D05G342300v1 [Gossypium barbadense]KAG4149055.1 hypothetical protein ERO13_D05G319866v2 [Gossypium hirsutum]TYH73920.1 hypothetical protein ES332_D05G362200v1 [Gossypium tomentosum]
MFNVVSFRLLYIIMFRLSFGYIFMLILLIVIGHLIHSKFYRKKMSSLEKERQDFLSTSETLKEGKYANS